jgi:uncharacterized membrane protein YtjA (UPF0391 family)
MLFWSLIFFIVAIVSGVFGFGGLSATAGGMAQTLFYIAIVLFLVSLVAGLARGRGDPIDPIV